MHIGRTLGVGALGLGMTLLACSGSPPEVPSNVMTVDATHVHDGKETKLMVGTSQLLACLDTARSVPMGDAHKCKMEDNDYTVRLNGGALVITIHTSTQFTIDHQGFFENECLFPMLYKAAHGEDAKPSDC